MTVRKIVWFGSMTILLASCGRAGSGLSRLQPNQIADRSRPATVQIISRFEASGTVAELVPDEDKLQRAFEREGLAAYSASEATERLLNLFYADPERYLKEGPLKELDRKVYALGTGFIVTPDGYVLTNAHVVEPDPDELAQAAVDSIVSQVEDEAAAMEKAVGELLPGKAPVASASARLKTVLAEQYAKQGKFHFNREVHLLMPSSRGDTTGKVDERTCEIKKVGEPNPGKDVAILKIDGSDLPTIPLAASLDKGEVRTGAALYVLGYPGSLTLDSTFSDRNRIQPSMTGGLVSNVKVMSGGWQVIQTDATIVPGNSGGPTLNDRGEVVGLATFGLKDQQGINFAESVDLAREFLRDLNVTPRESIFTQRYDAALTEYERQDHGHALRMFQTLSASYPELSGPRDFVRELEPAARAGATSVQLPAPRPTGPSGDRVESRPSRPPSGPPSGRRLPPALAVLGGVALVLAAAVGMLIAVNRR